MVPEGLGWLVLSRDQHQAPGKKLVGLTEQSQLSQASGLCMHESWQAELICLNGRCYKCLLGSEEKLAHGLVLGD